MPARPDRANEDFIAATSDTIVLLDGAGIPAGVATGCTHGVAWFAQSLGLALLAAVAGQPSIALPEGLARAIEVVADRHRESCDLTLGAPSATVVILREVGNGLEYLVLADSTLVLRTDEGVQVITDDREGQVGQAFRGHMDALPNGTEEHEAALADYIRVMRAHRNTDGGFWVAASEPDAATEAIHGTIPSESVRAALVLTDGATRLMDRFGVLTFSDAVDIVSEEGPAALLRRTRLAEASDQSGERWPRGKTYDDATVALATLSLAGAAWPEP